MCGMSFVFSCGATCTLVWACACTTF